jgi:hypothetical protein
VTVVSDVLRIKRTLDGAEIDKIIADVQTRKAMAAERWRRADWRKWEPGGVQLCGSMCASDRMR